MSEDMPIGLTFGEKALGIVLIVLGAIIAYYSTCAPEGDISLLSGVFTLSGLVVAATGVFLLIARNE